MSGEADPFREWNEAWRGLGHAIRKELQAAPLVGGFFRWYFELLGRMGSKEKR